MRGLTSAGSRTTAIGDIAGVMGYMATYNRDIKNGMSKEDALAKFNNYNETQQSRTPAERAPIQVMHCLLYTSPSPRDRQKSRMPSSA